MSDITRGGHSCCFSRFPQNGTVIASYPKFAKKRQNSLCPNVEKGGRDCRYRATLNMWLDCWAAGWGEGWRRRVKGGGGLHPTYQYLSLIIF